MSFIVGNWPSHAASNVLLRIHSCLYHHEIGQFARQSSLSITKLVCNWGSEEELRRNISGMRTQLNKPKHSGKRNIAAKQGHAPLIARNWMAGA